MPQGPLARRVKTGPHPPRETQSISRGVVWELFSKLMHVLQARHCARMARRDLPWGSDGGVGWQTSSDLERNARPDVPDYPRHASPATKFCFPAQAGLHVPRGAQYLEVAAGLHLSQNLWRGRLSSFEPCGQYDGRNLLGNWVDRN